jgi:hypothetical protein
MSQSVNVYQRVSWDRLGIINIGIASNLMGLLPDGTMMCSIESLEPANLHGVPPEKRSAHITPFFSPHNPLVAPDLQVSILGMTLLFLEWIDSFLVDRPGCIMIHMIHEDC